jgi:hypothetical protein
MKVTDRVGGERFSFHGFDQVNDLEGGLVIRLL